MSAALDSRLADWLTARNRLTELRDATDCNGYAPDCGCPDSEEDSSCAECGVHPDTFMEMLACIDAATALVAVLAEERFVTL